MTSTLIALGWTSARECESSALLTDAVVAARVIAHHRSRYVVGHAHGECDAVLRGRLRLEAVEAIAMPAVGDWLAVRRQDDSLAIIEAVLPRASAFVRQFAGHAAGAQVLAANVDVAFIVSAIGGDLNARRLERYATLAWESGALPVILLTKADLGSESELAAARSMASEAAPGVDVLPLSVLAEQGLDSLREFLAPGRTGVLLGSSGVGKSTLINHLLGAGRLSTGDLSADGRGRHTTTHRELVRLASGALLIDTPGMRELQLWSDGSGLDVAFADVDALAASCRYGDCAHGVEPDCRVRAALEAGELSPDRFESYLGLQREVARQLARTDVLAAAEAKRKLRALHRAQYHSPNPKAG